jgi:hypothetical protein
MLRPAPGKMRIANGGMFRISSAVVPNGMFATARSMLSTDLIFGIVESAAILFQRSRNNKTADG